MLDAQDMLEMEPRMGEAAKLMEIPRLGEASSFVIEMVKGIGGICKPWRLLWRPTPSSMGTAWMATDFNQPAQLGILSEERGLPLPG